MSGSVNKVILVGNLCADPEIKSFSNGGRIANLRVATNERWRTREGEQKERVEYHSVTLQSDGLISVAERFLRKGSKVYLEGLKAWLLQEAQRDVSAGVRSIAGFVIHERKKAA